MDRGGLWSIHMCRGDGDINDEQDDDDQDERESFGYSIVL